MSFKSKISNSKDYNYGNSPHIYSYKYNWINHFIHFLLNAFMKKSMFPFISISLYIIVIILNTIQYNNSSTYLQDKVKNTASTYKDSTSPQNILLYIYDFIGINGFTKNGLAHILYFIVSYICLALVEMNIGHIKLVFFLIVMLMFKFFEGGFQSAICENNLNDNRGLGNSSYCCGSGILWSALGFTLFIFQKHITDLYTKMYVWFIIACVWGGCVLFENYVTYGDEETSNQKNCKIFFLNPTIYILGIFCALVLSN
jgi:hypothetical protein